MELSDLLTQTEQAGASPESITKLALVFQDFVNPAELSKSLPPALQYIGPRPWINTVKSLYLKGTEHGGSHNE